MMEWQPIETAPIHQDILLWNNKVGFWIGKERYNVRYTSQNPVFAWSDSCGRIAAPTHWMPLPIPPKK